MTNGTTVHTTDYLDASTMLSTGSFQYYNNNLEFFPTAEGYVKQTTLQGQMTFDYVFNYTDHLGNIRVSYTKDPHTGDIKILEENHYYPFGLKHQKYADFSGKIDAIDDETAKAVIPDDPNQNITPYRNYDYKYNSKEWQDELGLNMYDMDMRMYDPAIARWVVMDPVIHPSMSPYNAFDDNPVFWADPSGAESESNSTNSDTGGEGTGITMMGIPLENMGVARIDVYGLGDGSQFSGSSSRKRNNSQVNSKGSGATGKVSAEWTPEDDAQFDGDPANHDPDAIQLAAVNANSKASLEAGLEQRANEALAIWSNWGRSSKLFSDNTFRAISGFAFGNEVKTQMFDYAVRQNYNLSWKQFNRLSKEEKALKTVGSLSKTGANYLKLIKGAGAVATVATTTATIYNTAEYYNNGGADWRVGAKAGLDLVMTGVGFLGPVGFGISAGYFILDAATGSFGGFGEIK